MQFLTASFLQALDKLINSRGFALLILSGLIWLISQPYAAVPQKLDRIIEVLASSGCIKQEQVAATHGVHNGQ